VCALALHDFSCLIDGANIYVDLCDVSDLNKELSVRDDITRLSDGTEIQAECRDRVVFAATVSGAENEGELTDEPEQIDQIPF
jgi:hypothetical protein